MVRNYFVICCTLLLVVQTSWYAQAAESEGSAPHQISSPLTLPQCLEIALEQNQKRRISKLAVETAEYQHKQAMSSFWPQLNFETGYNQLDEDVNFIFPENTYAYDITIPGIGTFNGETTVPEQDVTIMDRESILSRLNMTWPLFTGGLRSSMTKATDSNIKAAKKAVRRTELELIRDVQRMYYGVVLAQRLSKIGNETVIRLETTTELTERLYKSGSGAVTKLDYLRSKVVLDSARSIVEMLNSNVPLAIAALGNTMGLKWSTPFTLAETSIPFVEIDIDLNALVAGAYQFNPDWQRMADALDAAQALVKKEKSGHWPKVALSGTLWGWKNDLDGSGLATDDNKRGWSVGLGLQMPIFTGFMTSNKIKEAKTRLKKLKAQQILLKEGLALQIQHGVISVARSQKVRSSSMRAAGHAIEHRELAVNAYMNELVTTEVVIESQIFEALARAKAETAQYENAVSRFGIDFLIGREVQKLIETDS